MNGAARIIMALAREHERDWSIRLVRGVAFEREKLMEPWWSWTTWLAAGITIRRIKEAP